MNKLSIFHTNMAATKQSQLGFVLYISHILHAGSVTVITVISKQQKVREKRREGACFSSRLQLTLYYFKSIAHARLLDLGMTIHYL